MKFIDGGACAPKGFLAAAVNAEIKKGRKSKDLALIFSEVPAAACGAFTASRIKSACVLVSKRHLKNNRAQAIIANSQNANCCTGKQGLQDAYQMAEVTARALGINPHNVLVASTGVIGKYLPMGKIINSIPLLVKLLSTQNGKAAAEAIMTTDTARKESAVKFRLGKKDVIIGGIAKGAGMICPDMATMLSFITTDALIAPQALKAALKECAGKTFNCISIDGCMSTNDSVFVLANGASGNDEITLRTKAGLEKFKSALFEVTKALAKMIAADGEGATKLIEVCVNGAKNQRDAKLAGRSVCNSPLVKTAVYGRDANWGRIAAALGASRAAVSAEKLSIYFNDVKILDKGKPAGADEGALKSILQNREIRITADLGLGNSSVTMWTCDLSEEYVKINAKYTT